MDAQLLLYPLSFHSLDFRVRKKSLHCINIHSSVLVRATGLPNIHHNVQKYFAYYIVGANTKFCLLHLELKTHAAEINLPDRQMLQISLLRSNKAHFNRASNAPGQP